MQSRQMLGKKSMMPEQSFVFKRSKLLYNELLLLICNIVGVYVRKPPRESESQ